MLPLKARHSNASILLVNSRGVPVVAGNNLHVYTAGKLPVMGFEKNVAPLLQTGAGASSGGFQKVGIDEAIRTSRSQQRWGAGSLIHLHAGRTHVSGLFLWRERIALEDFQTSGNTWDCVCFSKNILG